MKDSYLRARIALLAWLAAIMGLSAVVPRFGQPPAYHQFAGDPAWAGIPHFWNVITNLPIGLAGLFGLWALRQKGKVASSVERAGFAAFFSMIVLAAFGSTYYHLDPTTPRLYWDRVPIALAIALLVAVNVAERLGPAWGLRLGAAWLAVGFTALTYWSRSEAQGAGDLRPYMAFQAASFGALPLLWALTRARHSHGSWYAWALACYALALACEHHDRPLYDLLGLGGHGIKHLLAAVAMGILAGMVRRRAPLTPAR